MPMYLEPKTAFQILSFARVNLPFIWRGGQRDTLESKSASTDVTGELSWKRVVQANPDGDLPSYQNISIKPINFYVKIMLKLVRMILNVEEHPPTHTYHTISHILLLATPQSHMFYA